MTPEHDKPVANFGSGAIATKRGLVLAESLTIAQWLDVGKRLFQLVDKSGWWVGDWLFYGQWTYGKKYVDAAAATGFEPGSLRNLSYVAGRFDLSRRRDNLSFAHHAEAAPLKPVDADRLLAEAEAKGWTHKQLRDAVRELRAEPAPSVPTPTVPAPSVPAPKAELGEASRDRLHVQFTIPRSRVESWTSAAAAAGKDFNDWACDVLDAAATLARAS